MTRREKRSQGVWERGRGEIRNLMHTLASKQRRRKKNGRLGNGRAFATTANKLCVCLRVQLLACWSENNCESKPKTSEKAARGNTSEEENPQNCFGLSLFFVSVYFFVLRLDCVYCVCVFGCLIFVCLSCSSCRCISLSFPIFTDEMYGTGNQKESEGESKTCMLRECCTSVGCRTCFLNPRLAQKYSIQIHPNAGYSRTIFSQKGAKSPSSYLFYMFFASADIYCAYNTPSIPKMHHFGSK